MKILVFIIPQIRKNHLKTLHDIQKGQTLLEKRSYQDNKDEDDSLNNSLIIDKNLFQNFIEHQKNCKSYQFLQSDQGKIPYFHQFRPLQLRTFHVKCQIIPFPAYSIDSSLEWLLFVEQISNKMLLQSLQFPSNLESTIIYPIYIFIICTYFPFLHLYNNFSNPLPLLALGP